MPGSLRRVVAADLEVVGDLERAPVDHLEALVLDVVDHELGQRHHVRRDQGDALGADAPEARRPARRRW